MTVAGEPDVERHVRQVAIAVAQRVERRTQAELQAPAVQRHAGMRPEDAGEMEGGAADERRDRDDRETLAKARGEDAFDARDDLDLHSLRR
jgi:hypothetical protein